MAPEFNEILGRLQYVRTCRVEIGGPLSDGRTKNIGQFLISLFIDTVITSNESQCNPLDLES